MQIQRIGYKVKGLYRVAGLGLQWGMIAPDAEKRHRILRYWEEFGLKATMAAFELSRRTLFDWKRRLKEQGPAGLTPGSTRPKRRRRPKREAMLVAEVKRLRALRPNLGREKLAVLLKPFCLRHGLMLPSARTLGRIIAAAPDKMRHAPKRLDPKGRPRRLRRSTRIRKPKGFRATKPGECVGFDSIERIRDGIRRYVVSAQDDLARVGFALAVPGHGSLWATRAFELTRAVLPMPILHALNDNGSEFAGHFAQAVETAGIPQWHTFPRTPKMNARCERFNRTLQEEFIDYHEDLLFENLRAFNDKLMDWLLWYNTERPHHALGLRTPAAVVAQWQTHKQCRMYWPNTLACTASATVVSWRGAAQAVP